MAGSGCILIKFDTLACDATSHCNEIGKNYSPQQYLFREYFHEKCYDSTEILHGTHGNNEDTLGILLKYDLRPVHTSPNFNTHQCAT